MKRTKGELQRVSEPAQVRSLIEAEYERTGGVFRLLPAWVGRPGIVVPGRRIRLGADYMSQDLAVNERWLASVTFSDNGVYNRICPDDHGLSYLRVGNAKVLLRDAIDECSELLLGRGRTWDVLPKFFDNWHRIPFHLHPCDDHCSPGLLGKPESYHFPEELNTNRNASPETPIGVDEFFSDEQVLAYLRNYFLGDNRLTDLANTINIVPGTGYFMPPCTLHAPGSLVTYELQVASDVTCIPESRVNDMVMPPDLIDRDIPVKIADAGIERVADYILEMVRCPRSGNSGNFRQEYYRPPANVRSGDGCRQDYVIYRVGKASDGPSPDLYSAKKTVVASGENVELIESGAFGTIVLGGHGAFQIAGKEPVAAEAVSFFTDREALGGDELFVAAGAAARMAVRCDSIEDLRFYQHFASGSNPQAATIDIPRDYRSHD